MFVDVTKTFLKFSITFILFVVAFALGFYTLLQDKFGLVHDNIGRSIVKTLVMMIGEFDFDDLFNGGESLLRLKSTSNKYESTKIIPFIQASLSK